mgnify:CR=1 FL=1
MLCHMGPVNITADGPMREPIQRRAAHVLQGLGPNRARAAHAGEHVAIFVPPPCDKKSIVSARLRAFLIYIRTQLRKACLQRDPRDPGTLFCCVGAVGLVSGFFHLFSNGSFAFKSLKLSPWGLDRSAMRLSAQNAAQRWSQTSIWSILAKCWNRGGGPLPEPLGCRGHFCPKPFTRHQTTRGSVGERWESHEARFTHPNYIREKRRSNRKQMS